MLARHAAVLKAFFNGTPPPPQPGTSWKQHFLAFDEAWLGMARRRSGRMLLRMRTECELSCPRFYGVPWHAGRGRSATHTHAVYDVTDFAPEHPGADELLVAANEVLDATDFFDAANHSERARLLLRRFRLQLDDAPHGTWTRRSPRSELLSWACVSGEGHLLRIWAMRLVATGAKLIGWYPYKV